MTRLTWINLALLGVVLALALIAYLRPPASAQGYPLSTQHAQAATRISIAFGNAPPALLERSNGHWKIAEPFTARADDFEVQNVLAILGAMATQRLPAQDLPRFGLAAPQLRVVINGQHFDFGAFNELTREQYVLTQNYVYPIQINYFAALPKDLWRFVDHQLFLPEESPVTFDFPHFKLMQRQGVWTLSPPSHVELSQDDFNRWIDNWRLASALSVQAADHRKPLATLGIGLKNGTTVQFSMLERAPQLTLVPLDHPAFEYQFTSDASQELLTPPGMAKK